MGLETASDVLFFFPRDYQDLTHVRSLDQLADGETISIAGTVEEIDVRNSGPGKSVLGALVRSGSGYLRAVWFNQPYMQRQLAPGQPVLLSGQVRNSGLRWEMVQPRVQTVDRASDSPRAQILPVYPLTEGLKQSHVRRVVKHVVETCAGAVEEVLPDEFLDQQRLWPIRAALPQIHFPSDRESLEQARRRFVFQELLVLQLALALRRDHRQRNRRARALPASPRIDARIRRLFPFLLTDDQQRAIREIVADMQREVPMNRLLHGDVGSGKTVVAVYAMLLAVAHGYQAALMAPTEVLAGQHFTTLQSLLGQARVRACLLTGSLTAGERQKALTAIHQGQVGLVIGTQSIIQNDVDFHRLGLVVIDEQHKFGVRQRAQLRHAGIAPHYLVMTATPIPRTVALTLFGDLEVSTLRQSPPGRKPINCYLARDDQREPWWEFFRRKLREGRQGYVITPLVDAGARTSVTGVEQALESLCNGPLEEFRIDLVHGRMGAAEKQAAMDRFRTGQTQVLVATSVVEVGIDVPNANLMTVENGDRFGLAQLHQLRGRVGRGAYPGYFCVFADAQTEEAQQRLQAIVDVTDGFELAEIDFRMRGPGELLGTKQHGLPPLRIADLLADHQVLLEARDAARVLVESTSGLADARYARLRRMVLRRYGKALDLGDVA
jgi:ATP-dependent DNA helicase RecG